MTKDWGALREDFYVGDAHPADRLIAMNCGCILVAPRCDQVWGSRAALNTRLWHQCGTKLVGPNLLDWVIASTYHFYQGEDGRGFRWQ